MLIKIKARLIRLLLPAIPLFCFTGCEQAVEKFILTTLEAQQATRDNLFRKDRISIVTCGTSSPMPGGSSVESCTAVFVNGQFLLFDAGNGSLNSMEESMLPLPEISAMFVTHFHADHWADMAEVIDRSWLLGRRSVFPIYGGPGIEQIVTDTTRAYSLEYGYRTAHHGEDVMPPRWVEVVPQTISVSGADAVPVYENDGVVVSAFKVNHPPIEPALGYKISYRDKTIVISGDTTATQTLLEQSRDADVLVSEVMNLEYIEMAEAIFARNGYEANARIFKDVRDYHIGTEELAQLAQAAQVRHLVLTHLAPNLDNQQIMNVLFKAPIKKIYSGELSLARDGNIYVIDL